MLRLLILALFGVAVTAIPTNPQRIVGGNLTTINSYPSIVVLLWTSDGSFFQQNCGGSILNTRSILTSATCNTLLADATRWRARAGSSFASSGGTIYTISQIMRHPSYNQATVDSDIAIWRVAATVVFSNVIQPASIPAVTYNLPDNEVVWAAGWGDIQVLGPRSEQLRHVQIFTINQQVCRSRYGNVITDNMLCAGVLDVGGRGQCHGDAGSPLYHRGIVVGLSSWGAGCAHPNFPGVNTRVSRFTPWIQANA